ncbi:TIGR02281 family clan AA aspartic protease [Defluviimonas sp. WL0024]|uniref:TIGR02281 family clan AA aspartic protease n=1 Tax=Albidovulum salinarum TaxID=2984153 RepID=A0ABT2WXS2_9RHOB|nr:TIGR02281 family clan AA aspartic protease [Defluviimonas sp. WL0024]MCU9846482.1 TIGR02281 family clan AA aspartic protease [Defluviimonas sp. WL0024]
MESGDFPRLVYLGLLLAVIAGYFLLANRRHLGKVAQQAAIWGLIFLGAIAVAGLWDDIRRSARPAEAVIRGDSIEVPASADGHFYLMAEVNGVTVRFVVDTGATDIVLTQRDAARAGLDPEGLNYFGTAMTANGRVATAPVRLDTLALGGVSDANVPAVVNGGELDTSLLGMSYLGRHEVTFSRDRMILRR